MEYSGFKDTLRQKEIKDLLDFILVECGERKMKYITNELKGCVYFKEPKKKKK